VKRDRLTLSSEPLSSCLKSVAVAVRLKAVDHAAGRHHATHKPARECHITSHGSLLRRSIVG